MHCTFGTDSHVSSQGDRTRIFHPPAILDFPWLVPRHIRHTSEPLLSACDTACSATQVSHCFHVTLRAQPRCNSRVLTLAGCPFCHISSIWRELSQHASTIRRKSRSKCRQFRHTNPSSHRSMLSNRIQGCRPERNIGKRQTRSIKRTLRRACTERCDGFQHKPAGKQCRASLPNWAAASRATVAGVTAPQKPTLNVACNLGCPSQTPRTGLESAADKYMPHKGIGETRRDKQQPRREILHRPQPTVFSLYSTANVQPTFFLTNSGISALMCDS